MTRWVGLPVGVTVKVSHEDWLVEAPAEVFSEDDEAEGAEEVAETVIKMLEAITKTSEVRLATGFAEAMETIDASHVGSPECEVAGTVATSGPAKELDPGPSMLEVRKGKGKGDAATPELVLAFPCCLNYNGVLPFLWSLALVDAAALARDKLSPIGKLDLSVQRGAFPSNQTLVDQSVLEEVEGRLNAALVEAWGTQEEVASLSREAVCP
ncbi:hypothetical protein Nepgr_019320 [Nepenthes gracilis]|uniref:Uncharacterized protein n=1 Tax=Nepenthes gracilis TaxID=150966 RepID=A0AAD3SVL7_NEPGR|nr:hypothetical protein Nepgr_019320 [Nepenthes gracilis]